MFAGVYIRTNSLETALAIVATGLYSRSANAAGRAGEAKAGLAAGNALVYGTAGIAIADVDYSAVGTSSFNVDGFDCTSTNVDCASVNDTKIGFAAGIGVGYPISDNMSLSFEYLYIGMPNEKDRYDTDEEDNPTDTDDYVNWTTSAHLARLSLVYEFN